MRALSSCSLLTIICFQGALKYSHLWLVEGMLDARSVFLLFSYPCLKPFEIWIACGGGMLMQVLCSYSESLVYKHLKYAYDANEEPNI